MPDIVHVLSADGVTAYARMLELSVRSCAAFAPTWRRVLLCDAAVSRSSEFHGLRKLFQETVEVDCSGDAVERSRFIKTRMGQFLDDQWLFLDGDTVVVGELDGLLSIKDALAMTLELCAAGRASVNPPPHYRLVAKHLGRALPKAPMFNSGVIWCGNPDVGKRFAECWHDIWIQARSSGEVRDQASLGFALEEAQIEVGELCPTYNALVRIKEQYRFSARVLHVQASLADARGPSAYAVALRRLGREPDWVKRESLAEWSKLRRPIIRHDRVNSCITAGDYFGAARAVWKSRVTQPVRELLIGSGGFRGTDRGCA